MKTQIIDNALDSEAFEKIQELLMGHQFPWYYADKIVGSPDFEDNDYFVHAFKTIPVLLNPLMYFINPNTLIRVKANSYARTEEIIHHGDHIDVDSIDVDSVEGLSVEEKKKLFEYRHKAAILYINTNNGLTVLEDGTECESVANRLLLFDATKPHHSTTCTDQKRRVNININYEV